MLMFVSSLHGEVYSLRFPISCHIYSILCQYPYASGTFEFDAAWRFLFAVCHGLQNQDGGRWRDRIRSFEFDLQMHLTGPISRCP